METFNNDKKEIKSASVKAGRRMYFFDIKETKNNDYYLVITESKRGEDGQYDRHKIFVYEEVFSHFAEGYNEMLKYIKTVKPEAFEEKVDQEKSGVIEKNVDSTETIE